MLHNQLNKGLVILTIVIVIMIMVIIIILLVIMVMLISGDHVDQGGVDHNNDSLS